MEWLFQQPSSEPLLPGAPSPSPGDKGPQRSDLAMRALFSVEDVLSPAVSRQRAALSRVMPRVRAIAVLPGQSVAKMWQKGNRLLLGENMVCCK